jgi:hypothetical protein
LFYRDIFLKSIPEKGVVKPMTDNLKENTHKTVDNTRMTAATARNDAKVNTSEKHNDSGMKSTKVSDAARMSTSRMHNDSGTKTQSVSDSVKTDAHKSVSDPKIAVHEAGADLKKAII